MKLVLILFVVALTGSASAACPAWCRSCALDNSCTSCPPGLILDNRPECLAGGLCVPAGALLGEDRTHCTMVDDSGACTSCCAAFSLSNGQCVPHSPDEAILETRISTAGNAIGGSLFFIFLIIAIALLAPVLVDAASDKSPRRPPRRTPTPVAVVTTGPDGDGIVTVVHPTPPPPVDEGRGAADCVPGDEPLPTTSSVLLFSLALLCGILVVALTPVGAMGYYINYQGGGVTAWSNVRQYGDSASFAGLVPAALLMETVAAIVSAACFIVAVSVVISGLDLLNNLRVRVGEAPLKGLALRWYAGIHGLAGGTILMFILTLVAAIVGGTGVNTYLRSEKNGGVAQFPAVAVNALSAACFFAGWAMILFFLAGGCCCCGGTAGQYPPTPHQGGPVQVIIAHQHQHPPPGPVVMMASAPPAHHAAQAHPGYYPAVAEAGGEGGGGDPTSGNTSSGSGGAYSGGYPMAHLAGQGNESSQAKHAPQ